MVIKAGSIQNLTDARYFASRNVDWIGFCFDPNSTRFINPREAQQIMGWLEGPRVLGQFGNQSLKEIVETAMILNLQGVQIDVEYFHDSQLSFDLPLIIRVKPAVNDNYSDIKALIEKQTTPLEYVLIDLTAHFSSWDQFVSESKLGVNGISQLASRNPVMLATQFNSLNILSILDKVKPTAIELAGAAEEKTGEKLFDELEEMFSIIA